MTVYTPDKYVLLKIETTEETFYKVFGSWVGGYANGDSWRLNSGIEDVIVGDGYVDFVGSSGSIYRVGDVYGTTLFTSGELNKLLEMDEVTLLTEEEAMEFIKNLAEKKK